MYFKPMVQDCNPYLSATFQFKPEVQICSPSSLFTILLSRPADRDHCCFSHQSKLAVHTSTLSLLSKPAIKGTCSSFLQSKPVVKVWSMHGTSLNFQPVVQALNARCCSQILQSNVPHSKHVVRVSTPSLRFMPDSEHAVRYSGANLKSKSPPLQV